jgi:TolA-binding protein
MAALRAPVAEEGGSAAEGSAEPVYATARERDEALVPQLEALIRDYPRSKAAVTAGYLHGAALLRLGRLEEARVSLESFLARHTDSDLAASARRTLARVEISAGKPEAAIAHLTGLAEHPSSLAPADAVLMDLGAAQELAGETEAAAKSYQRVITDFPQSSFAADAGRAVTRLGVPGKATS